MMKPKKGLGRGLDALLMADQPVSETPTEQDINLIDPNPDQPRKEFDPEKLQQLAASIREHGVIQPVLVVPRDGRYLLVAGERRYRAARLAELVRLPAIVREYDERQISEIALVENLQRDGLNPIEEAAGIRSLIETFHITQEKVSERLGMSRPAVANSLRLLSLEDDIQQYLRDGRISAGHARAILSLQGGTPRRRLAEKIDKQGLSVRQAEEMARLSRLSQEHEPARKRRSTGEFREFEENLTRAFGVRASVKGDLAKGKITLSYTSREDLERLYALAELLARGGGRA